MPERVRLHKYIASCGLASRRAAEKMIADGRVRVNGEIITTAGTKINPRQDNVQVDNVPVQQKKENKYILLFKPRGTITTVRDPFGRKTVMELLPYDDIFPVGRLDQDTEGLLLLTDDGELAYRLTHPRFKVRKKYHVWVKGTPAPEKLKLLREGINLEEGSLSPAEVKTVNRKGECCIMEIIIHEGKKRQIKRMCFAIGHPVISLKRVGFAFLTLKGLRPGAYRHLKQEEVKRLKHLAGLQ